MSIENSQDQFKLVLEQLEKLTKDVRELKDSNQHIQGTLGSLSRRLGDIEDFKRDFKLSVQDFPGAAEYRPAEPRRGYPGGALIERDEDKEEWGLKY